MIMPQSLKYLSAHREAYEKSHPSLLNADQRHIVEQFLNALVRHCDPGLCVPIHAWHDILVSNVLKNRLELNQGSVEDQAVRREAIHHLFGCPKQMNASAYPKYGFLMDPDILRHILQDGNLVFQYGSVILKLKKQAMWTRTTMTVGNSLNFQVYKHKCPMNLNESRISCIPMRHQPPFYDAVVSGKCKWDMPGAIGEVFSDLAALEYYECQYHGRIAIDRDVEKVYLYPTTGEDETIFRAELPILAQKQIPWEILSF